LRDVLGGGLDHFSGFTVAKDGFLFVYSIVCGACFKSFGPELILKESNLILMGGGSLKKRGIERCLWSLRGSFAVLYSYLPKEIE
jgi:hypothetical protein